MQSPGNMLYMMHELQHLSVQPLRIAAKLNKQLFNNPLSPFSYTVAGRQLAAANQLLERITRRYGKPEFGIETTIIEDRTYKVTEKIIKDDPFCSLMKFHRAPQRKDPKMLVVAPMSGHYATLLRGTVEALIPHYEVYITDWADARDVPAVEGTFDLDDFIDYLISYMELLGPDVHVMAVCQPAVPLLAATSIMATEKNPHAPRSMTLIGGPIDTRINPTEVNRLATEKPIEWFENNVISMVPINYPGFMRKVYPGFMQLTGFMTMNLERHIGEHVKLFNHLVQGDGESVDSHKKFYNEYLSVMDLPAEFYLQTVKTVFQKHALPKGTMHSRGRPVRPQDIKKTALLTLEGELDDISGVGQTKAAQDLCSGLAASKKHHYMQKSVGHYGIFNGRRYREHVVPQIIKFTTKHSI